VVDADEMTMVGGRMKVQGARGLQPPEILRVEISGEIRGGSLTARSGQRSWWQRLLPRDGPGQRSG
jgi:hypothetical protein